MPYEAVIFDNDGVLTHPTPDGVVRDAVHSTFIEFGVDPSPEHIEAMVRSEPERIHRICAIHDIDPEQFWARREANSAAAQRELLHSGEKPLYDDFDAVRRLRHDLGVVSNNQHETVQSIVDVFDLDDVFEVTYGREPSVDGVRRKKPEPDYLERAMSDLAVEDVLYVGDSNADLLAADAAGVDSAFIQRPHRTEYELATAPTHEIESLDALLDIVH